ncbi:MAG: hypothetical protein AABX53_03685 [Nanoarchaeota archaeon]|mgnify:FL=1
MPMQQEPVSPIEPYEIRFNWPSDRAIQPRCDFAPVLVVDAERRIYEGNVVTSEFIRDRMNRDSASGECAHGAYFAVPQMIVVRSIDEGNLRATVDDLVARGDFGDYFLQR